MLRGTRLSAGALLPRIRAQELIANNLANVQTGGFRRERLAFHALLSEAGLSTPALATRADDAPAALQTTGNALDVALDGQGYFVVQSDGGERYTRAGAFQLGPSGQLITSAGHSVQGQGGEIVLPAGSVDIDATGAIRVDGQVVETLRVVSVDPSDLVREGENLFSVAEGKSPGEAPDGTRVRQGHLEESNVESVVELVEMIRIFREYETNHAAMMIQGDTLGKLIDQQIR